MNIATPQSLRYSLKYAGHAAGEQRLLLEPRRDGLKVTLEAQVELPLPKTRQRWESEMDALGLPRKYRERVEGNGARLMEVEFSREDGLVTVSQGKEDFAIPYLAEMHDPLSLILAVGALELEVGQVKTFAMVGGRAYAERMPDQTLKLLGEEEKPVRVYRLRPGLSLLYFDAEDYPVRLTQKVGEHVFEAELTQVQRLERGSKGQEPRVEPQERSERRIVAGEPPKERQPQENRDNRRRRRRRKYN